MKLLKLLAALLCLMICAAPAAADSPAPLKVLAGTSLVEDIVRDLTDGRAEILTLIPGASCPGHNDLKAVDLLFAAKADLVVIHSFQEDMTQLQSLMSAVKRPDLAPIVIPVEGSWLVPEAQKEAASAIAEALIRARPDMAEMIRDKTRLRLVAVDRLAEESLAALAPLRGRPVAVSERQSELVKWAGLEVAAEYGRAEEMSARQVAGLVEALRGRGLAAVIDNLQSGPEAGLPLARELGAPHLVLSNFSGHSPEAADYFGLVRLNVSQLSKLGAGR